MPPILTKKPNKLSVKIKKPCTILPFYKFKLTKILIMTAKFSTAYKIYINHTDAGGIVYHANHLIFLENCRRDWLTSLGFDGYFFIDKDTDKKIHFVVSEAVVRYHLPLLIDDTIIVSIQDVQVKAASLIIHQNIYRSQDDFTKAKVASSAEIVLACVCHTPTGIRPYRILDRLKDKIS